MSADTVNLHVSNLTVSGYVLTRPKTSSLINNKFSDRLPVTPVHLGKINERKELNHSRQFLDKTDESWSRFSVVLHLKNNNN